MKLGEHHGEVLDFEEYVRTQQDALLRTARRLVSDPTDAEDLLQTALLRTCGRWEGIADKRLADAYLRRVMINTRTEWWRVRRLAELPTEQLPDTTVDDPTEQHAVRALLMDALKVLTPRQRSVVVLRHWEQMSTEETATALGIPAGTVKSTLHRALIRLRQELERRDLESDLASASGRERASASLRDVSVTKPAVAWSSLTNGSTGVDGRNAKMNFPAADAELVSAARQGAQGALEELVGRYLPLVYNIVGRALPGPTDVDDVVQETMLGVVRGLSGLCDGSAFRPWLVAVTMSQIRTHRESYPAPPRVLEELAVVADPGADFVDLTLNRLQLSGQRRETAEATRWLDADDRELLSLWWLVTAGHLTQAEMVAAIGLDAHHVTLRVTRMKSQLDIARVVARALAVTPRCSDLERTIHLWDGRPGGLWRKRLARHVRGCGSCGGPSAGLVPLEGLLANLALVPLPLGYTAFVLSGIGYEKTSAATAAGPAPVSHRRTRRNSRHRNGRSLGSFTGNPMVVAAAFTATLTAAVGIGALTSGPDGEKPMAGRQPGLSAPDDAGSTEPHTTTPAPATTTAPTPTPAATTPHEPTAAPSRTRHTPASIPRTTVPGHRADSAVAGSEAAAAAEVLSVINQARAAHNMAPLETSTGLESSSGAHNRTMATGCGLQHECPGEAQLGDRETVAGVRWGAAGENIGTDGSLAHTTADLASRAVGLTKSMLAEQPPNDGHRRNILNPDFHHIGINVLHGGSGNLWLTQDFAD